MKRKKWSEAEERSLLNKYADLVNSGTLTKLKTREKKFKPIAEYVNQLHHHQDPNAFPFKWSWRDVSIKVQNMRHQYLGVKQKIRTGDEQFNWTDGENHWDNFTKYKEVFGDVDLQIKDSKKLSSSISGDDDEDEVDEGFGLGFTINDDAVSDGQTGVQGIDFHQTRKKLGLVGGRDLELSGGIAKMSDKKRQRELDAEMDMRRRMDELQEQWEEDAEMKEMQREKDEMEWEKRQLERWMRMEEELERERQWRMKVEEKREEEEMEFLERMVRLQIEHEKSMMQMYSDAWQNQMQILGVFGRLLCQFFESTSANDGLGAMQNMPGDIDDNVKPDDTNLQSPFL
ncbi:hypothetical protein QQ045_005669 [Rhodiola kirilowii]